MKENRGENMPEKKEGLKILETQDSIFKNEQELKKVEKTLKELKDDLSWFTNLLKNEEERLLVAEEDNILVENEPEQAEVLDITTHTKEEMEELKEEIKKTKIRLLQIEQRIDSSNFYKNTLQSRIKYSQELENKFKKALVKIRPEKLQ